MSDPNVGIVDMNVFVHAQSHDSLSQECRDFLDAVQRGTIQVELPVVVLHELTYVLPRYLRQFSRVDVVVYLRSVLSWPGIHGDKDLMIEAVNRWARTPGLSFVDAYLSALATRRQCPVYTKNIRELVGQGVDVPAVLPVA